MQKYCIFIGIDLSKRWFNAALYWAQLEARQIQAKFNNNPDGFKQFLAWVTKQVAKHQLEGSWYVCMEHTGIYGLALAQFLEKRQIKTVMECPLRISMSLGLRRGKTDSADAADIASYAQRHYRKIKARALPSPVLLQVQALLSLRRRLMRYRQGMNMGAKEPVGFLPRSISDSVQDFTLPITSLMKKQIKVVDKQIKQLICQDEQLENLYALVTSVVGIGPLIGAYLLVYTNGFTAFRKARQFNCYIGTAPFPYQSGSSIKRPDKVSHLANHRMKALISTAATVAVCHDPQLKAFFEKHQANGKDDGWIYNTVKNKIIYRVFAVVKRGTAYVVMDKHQS